MLSLSDRFLSFVLLYLLRYLVACAIFFIDFLKNCIKKYLAKGPRSPPEGYRLRLWGPGRETELKTFYYSQILKQTSS